MMSLRNETVALGEVHHLAPARNLILIRRLDHHAVVRHQLLYQLQRRRTPPLRGKYRRMRRWTVRLPLERAGTVGVLPVRQRRFGTLGLRASDCRTRGFSRLIAVTRVVRMVPMIEIEPSGLGYLGPPDTTTLTDRDQPTIANSVGRMP
ncbi:hypothetical protein N599_11255 [Saccharopolyspora erythraea D]|nr:hypothetical protein N599_11255 [Saccharopolyspora erythraea D]